MKALTHSPAEIFGNAIRYVVPLFQRPYVWNEKDQWQPLWEDVRAVAERLLDAPAAAYGAPQVPPHFLGAIVIEQQISPVAHIGVRHVIDGQQRLTTLQLLLDAAQWVVARHGAEMDAQALLVLVENNRAMSANPDDVFKVWPTDRDQDAFRAAMDDDTVVPASLSGSRIAQAHKFFVEVVQEWADLSGDPGKVVARLSALTRVLRDHLRLVVIDLEPGDNAQVIFETLNHRGSPLLASDLVKNLVFQIATHQQLDVEALYRKHWRDLDDDHWRQSVAQGRLYRPRIDVFLNRWLTMKLLREVQSDRVFSDFRDFLMTGGQDDVAGLLAEISRDARIHREMESLPLDTVPGRFHYRVLKAMDTQVVAPFLLWLLRQPEGHLPEEQRDKALGSLESWLVRRALCRVTTKDHNRVVLELLKEVEEHGAEVAGDTVERFLAGQSADSRYWPNDATLAVRLSEEPVYSSLIRARMRMLLEAMEDRLRGPLGEGQPCPQGLTVEHVMPQAWREHWGADIAGDELAGLRRDRLVHTLGNLTLVNAKLNPTLSNRPWTDAESASRGLPGGGKRDYLLQHSQLSLNSRIVTAHPVSWTEDDIRARTAEAVEALVEIWPCPSDAVQAATARSADESVGGATGMVGKYEPLRAWLAVQEGDELRLTFAEIEEVLPEPLPDSARKHYTIWYAGGGSPLSRSIKDAGWRARNVSLGEERLTLQRLEAEAPSESEELLGWGDSEEDVAAARYLWQSLSPAGRRFFQALMDASPRPLPADELAEVCDIPNGALGVAGVLAWPGRYVAQMGRHLPSEWAPGDPATYRMKPEVSRLFAAVASEAGRET
ncbi:DUF262 domain-containing protein [Nocardioides sp. GY 10113]|uniref:GmrSD restriction endonuclease domain-containing protein n=1 Tax=Nocardioides sp. GY 10113 TaxID=2569761 RepID=UPI0010A79369|nr:DUF262 domain-containing protein [Nocardioides sp. GY 10113]TIC86709.1 DUF262 domain-containing protein [Nocardioides sp. GY 10113]